MLFPLGWLVNTLWNYFNKLIGVRRSNPSLIALLPRLGIRNYVRMETGLSTSTCPHTLALPALNCRCDSMGFLKSMTLWPPEGVDQNLKFLVQINSFCPALADLFRCLITAAGRKLGRHLREVIKPGLSEYWGISWYWNLKNTAYVNLSHSRMDYLMRSLCYSLTYCVENRVRAEMAQAIS